MAEKHLFTRKDIALLLVDCSPDQVRKNEKRWGIDKARRDLNPRCVRYLSSHVITILRAKGYLQ